MLLHTQTNEMVKVMTGMKSNERREIEDAVDKLVEQGEGEASKPELKLTGESGNAFAILGAAHKTARRAGWPEEQWERVRGDAMSGDYDHLLQVMMKYFDVS